MEPRFEFKKLLENVGGEVIETYLGIIQLDYGKVAYLNFDLTGVPKGTVLFDKLERVLVCLEKEVPVRISEHELMKASKNLAFLAFTKETNEYLKGYIILSVREGHTSPLVECFQELEKFEPAEPQFDREVSRGVQWLKRKLLFHTLLVLPCTQGREKLLVLPTIFPEVHTRFRRYFRNFSLIRKLKLSNGKVLVVRYLEKEGLKGTVQFELENKNLVNIEIKKPPVKMFSKIFKYNPIEFKWSGVYFSIHPQKNQLLVGERVIQL